MPDIRVATGLESRTNQLTKEIFDYLNGFASDRARQENWDGRELFFSPLDVVAFMCIDHNIPPEMALHIMQRRMAMHGDSAQKSPSKITIPGGRPLGSTEGI